jgi:hypothetical protein
MKEINSIRLERVLEPGGALYSIVEDGGTFLLGLGLWDRVNAQHTKEVKDCTKGQVVRVDKDDNILARSPELDNIIYQIVPTRKGIFVGCRNGTCQYLNEDLSIDRMLDLKTEGLYFTVLDGDELIATTRTGEVLYFNIETEEKTVVPVVDSNIRMWPVLKKESGDGVGIVAGSYKGHLALIVDKKLKRLEFMDNPAAIWTIDSWLGNLMVGNARGEWNMHGLDLHYVRRMCQFDTGITATARLNDWEWAIGDLKGDIHIVSSRRFVVDNYVCPKENPPNTVWWLTPDHETHQLRAAYSNGQMRTFRLE